MNNKKKYEIVDTVLRGLAQIPNNQSEKKNGTVNCTVTAGADSRCVIAGNSSRLETPSTAQIYANGTEGMSVMIVF